MTKRKSRPEVLPSRTTKFRTNCGNLYLRFGYDETGNVCEIFATIGKSGNCVYGLLEAVSRLLCEIFKYDIELDDKIHAVEQLRSINCGNGFILKGDKYLSCTDLIAKATLAELNKVKP